MNPSIHDAAKTAHHQVWSRFIHRPYGIVLDYADKDGRVPLPTAEDCARSMPNALSWWVSTENGAFFTGLYLAGLLAGYESRPEEGLLDKIELLVHGLFRLQDVCSVPGMIARGVSADGSAHYALGSDDQTGPWLYGLWRAWNSAFLPAVLREETGRRILAVVQALADSDFLMPTAWPGQYRGEWIGDGFREASRLLFACRIAHEISGDARWLTKYEAYLHGKPEGCYRTRLAILEDGFSHHMIALPSCVGQFWIYFGSHASLLALYTLETDEAVRAAFRRGLRLNGVCAAPYILHYVRYDNANADAFDVDWRKLEALWKPQATVEEAVRLAEAQHRHWTGQMVPRKAMEYHVVRQPLYAAWIALLSLDADTAAFAREHAAKLLRAIDWTTLYTSEAYVAECVYYVLAGGGESQVTTDVP